jgi:preprotein translocase subunit YajC
MRLNKQTRTQINISLHGFSISLITRSPAGAGWMNLVFFGLLIVVFYFFLIRPQNKRQKEQKSFVESIEKGDEVVTASGIIGRVNKLDEHTVTLEVGTKNFIRMTKTSISKEMTEAFRKGEEPVETKS